MRSGDSQTVAAATGESWRIPLLRAWILAMTSAVLLLLAVRPVNSAPGRDFQTASAAADLWTDRNGQANAGDGGTRLAEWLEISLAERVRFESLDHRYRLGEEGSDQQLPQRTRVGVQIKKVLDPFRFGFEFEDSRSHLTDSASYTNQTIIDHHDILQFYGALAFNQKPGAGLPSTLYFGRQSFDLGNRRLFARNRYRNTTNRFDGIRWSIGSPKKWSLDAFLFQPVRIRMDDMDRRVKGAYFWGGYLTVPWKAGITAETYYFGLHEDPNLAQSLKRRYTTIGGRLSNKPAPKSFVYEFETAWQFGKLAALDHFAHLQHLQLGYSFGRRWEPFFGAQYDYASGDKNPFDGRDEGFDTLYGARRWEYGPTGIYNWMYRSNISSPALYFSARPARKIELIPSARWLWLAQKRAAWAGQGLRDPTGQSGAYVGWSMEWRLRYNFAPYFRPEIGYTRFFKGTYPERVPGSPTSEDSNYFFVELELRLDNIIALFSQSPSRQGTPSAKKTSPAASK